MIIKKIPLLNRQGKNIHGDLAYGNYWTALYKQRQNLLNSTNYIGQKSPRNSKPRVVVEFKRLVSVSPKIVKQARDRFEHLRATSLPFVEVDQIVDLLWIEKAGLLASIAHNQPADLCMTMYHETDKLHKRILAFLNHFVDYWAKAEKPLPLNSVYNPNLVGKMEKIMNVDSQYAPQSLRMYQKIYFTQKEWIESMDLKENKEVKEILLEGLYHTRKKLLETYRDTYDLFRECSIRDKHFDWSTFDF